ncbi:MAG: glycosyltransferase family 2 protein [Candidatus Moranbacteria bacterium]|nr:glycosyltransferase family 2 protein [Candidatus Moranbacteria bacterium]
MIKYPKVFIVVLNHNGKATVQKCLAGVFKLGYPNFEVVFVDNGSDDGSLELAKTNFSKANFIKNAENLGCAVGKNIGIRFSLERMADYVLLLNSDMEVDKDFLSRLIDAADSDSSAGLFSPIIFEGGTKQILFSGGKIDWLKMRLVYAKKIQTEDLYGTEFVTGQSMLVKAEVFKKVGLFDEDFFLHWGDVDFSFRAGKAGFKKMMVSASWVYRFGKNEKEEGQDAYWRIISGLIFFKKNIKIWMKPWVGGRVWLGKMKNWLDIRFRRNEADLMTQRAYRDLKRVEFQGNNGRMR